MSDFNLEDREIVEVELSPIANFFTKDDFRIYEVLPSEEALKKMYPNKYGKYTIKGDMPELDASKKYMATLEAVEDNYGKGYNVKLIYEKELETQEEMRDFLSTILTEKQATAILDAYPYTEIIDLAKEGKLDHNKIKGVGEATIDKVINKIVEGEKFKKSIIHLTVKYGIPYKSIKKLSEEYKSPELLIKAIDENPYVLLKVNGFGFKRVDAIALKSGIDPKSAIRMKAGIVYVLNEKANEGHTYTRTLDVLRSMLKELMLKKNDVLPYLSVGDYDEYQVSKNNIYLKKYYNFEKEISENIARILEGESVVQVNEEDFAKRVEEVEKIQGFNFVEEQLEAIRKSIKHNVLVVNGKAGTGKTSVIKGISKVLNANGDYSYNACALSGKASLRIEESTGLNASTIHRMLGYSPNGDWIYTKFNPMESDIVIVDESSMVNSELFYRIVTAIPTGAKLIIVGDVGQLESIGAGAVLNDLITSELIPTAELNNVHRQALESGSLSTANHIRDNGSLGKVGANLVEGLNKIGKNQDLWLFNSPLEKDMVRTAVSICKKYKGDIMDFQIITPLKKKGNVSVAKMNSIAQKLFNKSPDDVPESEKAIRKNGTVIMEGDKVIVNSGNLPEKNVYNGSMGILEVLDLNNPNKKLRGVTINFENIGNVFLTKDEFSTVELGYAISTHKSQGSEWDFVLLMINGNSSMLHSSEMLYTAMTRVKKHLFLISDKKTLYSCASKSKGRKRKTFLKTFLKNDVKNDDLSEKETNI